MICYEDVLSIHLLLVVLQVTNALTPYESLYYIVSSLTTVQFLAPRVLYGHSVF
jgi:hypothetical protein